MMGSGCCLPWAGPPPCPTRAFSKSPPSSFPPNLTTLPPCRKILRSQLPGFCKTLLSRRINGVSDSERRFLHPSGSQEEDENERKEKEGLGSWDSLTGKFAAAANVPFLLLQMPQIVLNCRNLLAGNKSALFAIPWIKRETEAVIVQTLGVISTYVVIVQLALADAMPSPHFIATSTVVLSGLFLNLLNYFSRLSQIIWTFWEDFITIGGISVLPQVMWPTFVPYIPQIEHNGEFGNIDLPTHGS